MSGPVLPGEEQPAPAAPARMGIYAGALWLRVGGQGEVFRLSQQLPPDSPLRSQLLGLLPLIDG